MILPHMVVFSVFNYSLRIEKAETKTIRWNFNHNKRGSYERNK